MSKIGGIIHDRIINEKINKDFFQIFRCLKKMCIVDIIRDYLRNEFFPLFL